MRPMEKQFISNLQDKEAVSSIFVLKDRSLHVGKNGRPYLSLVLADRTGELDARAWDNVEDLTHQMFPGDIVKIRGTVQIFQNRKQLVVHRMERALEKDIDFEHLVRTAPVGAMELRTKLAEHVSGVNDPWIKSLLERAFEHPDVQKRFFVWPAAKSIHHAYRTGLLEHVVSICDLMKSVSGHYPFLNKDLLIFGAIFHDLGKIWELNAELNTSYTDEGRLLGHLVMSVEFIEKLASQIEGFPEELKWVLKHIVLSHHGKLEYGSPKLPQFLEAFIVAAIDDFDSKINAIFGFMQNERANGQKWTRFNQMHERYFYLGVDAEHSYHVPSAPPDSTHIKEQQKVWSSTELSSKRDAGPIETMEEEPMLSIPQSHEGLTYRK